MRGKVFLRLVLACAFPLLGCGGPADVFSGEWEVAGSEWFGAKGQLVQERSNRIGDAPVLALPALGAKDRTSEVTEVRAPDAVWLVPSVGRTHVAGVADEVQLKVGGCLVTAHASGSDATVKPGFRCKERLGGAELERTFDSGTLRAEGDGLKLTAAGTFTLLYNGTLMSGAFASNLEYRMRR